MSGIRGQARAHEDAQHFCERCGNPGFRHQTRRGTLVTRGADGRYLHGYCREAEKGEGVVISPRDPRIASTTATIGRASGEYERRRCPARVRPICSACGFAISAGQVMAVLPHVDQQHWACYQKGAA